MKKGGARRATRHFATKKAAEAFGRQVSFNQKTELVIHRRDGSIMGKSAATEERPDLSSTC